MEWRGKKLGLLRYYYEARICPSCWLLIVLFSSPIHAQVIPAEGSKLHYRIVKFSVPQMTTGAGYTFEIARGNYETEDSFKKNIVVSVHGSENKIIAEV